MIYEYIGRHQMNRRSYFCLYVYDNSKEFKIGIAGFSIYGTKSEKLRFYLGSSTRNFFSPPNSKCRRGPWSTGYYVFGAFISRQCFYTITNSNPKIMSSEQQFYTSFQYVSFLYFQSFITSSPNINLLIHQNLSYHFGGKFKTYAPN